jgi:hypothetical protein
MVDRTRSGPKDSERLVAHFPAVAIRAMEEIATPAFPRAVDVRQLIDGTGRQENVASLDGPAAAEAQLELRTSVDHGVFDDLNAIAANLVSRNPKQFGGRHPVAREEALHVLGRRVARRAGVDDNHAAARAAEDQRGTQPGSSAANDRNVIESAFHEGQPGRPGLEKHALLLFLGSAVSVGAWWSRTSWPRSALV